MRLELSRFRGNRAQEVVPVSGTADDETP